MQVSLEWINELVNLKSTKLEEVMETLTLGGFEVEDLLHRKISNKNQLAMEISATANRSDSLSIQGISTEMSTLFKKPVQLSKYALPVVDWKKKIDQRLTILSNQLPCSAFTTVILENVTNLTVPKWITHKLMSSNITITNSFLDFENYILLETGYTFAVYDFSKICSQLKTSTFRLSLSKGKAEETFLATNGVTYTLNDSILVVRANHLVLSLAGMISNHEYEYSPTTKSLLLEASIFDASKIRRQSRSLGLRTHRSSRYEKGVKNKYLLEALYRFIFLVKISNPDLRCQLQTNTRILQPPTSSICLTYQGVTEILGPIAQNTTHQGLEYLSAETISQYLKRLRFKFVYDESKLTWEVTIPELRNEDITREIDLIEELGRLHGFNNFLTTLPHLPKIGTEDISYQTRKKITSSLIQLGLKEMIHYSLVQETYLIQNKVPLINPMLSEYSNLRSQLLPHLIQTLQENIQHRNLPLESFEYGHVFFENSFQNLEEKECLAGIFLGIKTKLKWSNPIPSVAWFDAKGKMEQFFQQLNLLISWEIPKAISEPIFHPSKTAELYLVTGKKVGIFGQMNPRLCHQLGIFSEIYLFELELEPLQEEIQKKKLMIYHDYSVYPKIIKDLSFIIPRTISFQILQQFLKMNGTKFLSELHLLDEYVGPSIPENHKSICLQLVFQSKETTLETKNIDVILHHLQRLLQTKFQARMRE